MFMLNCSNKDPKDYW